MAQCIRCGSESPLISSPLCICADCIRTGFDEVKPHIESVHASIKESFQLPPSPPRDKNGLQCDLCINKCRIAENERGYCGIRHNDGVRIVGGGVKEGHFSSYHDPLPTNCVGEWVCPAGAGCGYPEYSFSPGAEFGYKNLAVFFKACTFNCLFCQNWHYREESRDQGAHGPDAIADRTEDQTACVCYFGGDPTPQLLHAIKASGRALKKRENGILRICWETNGAMNPKYLGKIAKLSMQSGGCVKFDLKAWNDDLHYALCGVSNRWTLSNFRKLADFTRQRPDPPFLIASTLLVPGYIEAEEVGAIARFIARLNPDIPYSLLGFYPHFFMRDLPRTSENHAGRCFEAARNAGLTRVKIGNIHLLSRDY